MKQLRADNPGNNEIFIKCGKLIKDGTIIDSFDLNKQFLKSLDWLPGDFRATLSNAPSPCGPRRPSLFSSGVSTYLSTILCSNVRACVNKIDDLLLSAKTQQLDILCITETWLNEDISDDIVSLPNYSLMRDDRLSRRGGGVAIWLSNNLAFTQLRVANIHGLVYLKVIVSFYISLKFVWS